MSAPAASPIEGPEDTPIRRALLSVSDKTGLADLAAVLVRHGVSLLSTGGTARALRDMGHEVVDISDHTGMPEMMDGRVKTLHPRVHGGLLAVRDDPAHARAMTDHDIAPIDLVVVNLYPFEKVAASAAPRDEVIENIDIGGPSMLRSAAKNHAYVTVVTDPADYAALIADMDARDGAVSRDVRRSFAARAFARTAAYDTAIADWFDRVDQQQAFPTLLPASARRADILRYGENPHQDAAFYALGTESGGRAFGVGAARQVQGKALSYNNLNDADGALELICTFRDAPPTVAIIKHANPCGVAQGADVAAAYAEALACDPVSAFGGIVAVNRPLDAVAARAITAIFTEVVVAPDADAAALEIFAAKKNLRLLLTGPLAAAPASPPMVKSIMGGYLVQARDQVTITPDALRCVTKRAPSDRELRDLIFAWTVAAHVKSNAIVYARDGVTAGIGAGQMSRVDSARIAAWKAEDAARTAGWPAPRTQGSVLASDAFFPFADGLLAAIAAGARAVIQPGGSIRDDEVIAAADAHDVAMVFTGMRHFRH